MEFLILDQAISALSIERNRPRDRGQYLNDHKERKNLPLIYSCSGCSNVAQIANAVAVRLDRDALMEMSCIAGVGGDVPSLVRTAKSGRAVWVIDGCPMECARHCLKRHAVEVNRHFVLSDFNLKKIQHELPEDSDIELIYDFVRYQLEKI